MVHPHEEVVDESLSPIRFSVSDSVSRENDNEGITTLTPNPRRNRTLSILVTRPFAILSASFRRSVSILARRLSRCGPGGRSAALTCCSATSRIRSLTWLEVSTLRTHSSE